MEKITGYEQILKLMKDFEPIIQLVGIILGAILIVWQMSRQHNSNLELQRENYREELRLNIYRELKERINDCIEITVSLSSALLILIINLEYYRKHERKELNLLRFQKDTNIINKESKIKNEYYGVLKTTLSLAKAIEDYEIVNPNLKIFRMAFSAASHDIRNSFISLDSAISKITRSKEDTIQHLEEKFDEFRNESKKFNEALNKLTDYVHDFGIEAQNLLLGNLFEYKLPQRKPLDQNLLVITTKQSDVDKLEKYFNEETDWGKTKQKAENDVRRFCSKNR